MNFYGLLRFINIDDLERPLTFKRSVSDNFLQFLAAAHISKVNCEEMAGDRPKQSAYDIFNVKGRF